MKLASHDITSLLHCGSITVPVHCRYLEGKIKAGEAHSILCPEYGCYKLVPLVSRSCNCHVVFMSAGEQGSFLILTLLDFKEVNMAIGRTPEGLSLAELFLNQCFMIFI